MTLTQMKNKLENLDFWLTNNPHHPDYQKVLSDKKELEIKYNTEKNEYNRSN